MKVDITKPPICPPNRTWNRWPLFGWRETKQSKQEQEEYDQYLSDYRRVLRNETQRLYESVAGQSDSVVVEDAGKDSDD